MKKFSLIAILLFAVLLLQNCKKDTVTASTTSTEPLIALINDTTWTADTLQASVTYNSATKSKVFAVTGTAENKQISWYVTQDISTGTTGFPLATFTVNTTTDNEFSYLKEQKNTAGTYVLTSQGVIAPGSGSVVVSSIDSVKKIITGTFSFNVLKNNYDSNGNIVSVSITSVTAGGFNSIPYTFVSH